MRLKGKVAIVTGSSRGIGKAIAIDFAREGADVVVIARSEAEGKLPGTIYKTAQEIEALGGKALPIKCDVSNEAEVEAMVKKSLDHFGKVDILVNNAAVGCYYTVMETPLKLFDLLLKVNLRGPFLCIKAVAPIMIKQGSGSIINITSSAAHEIFSRAAGPGGKRPTLPIYGATKAALDRLTLGLAAELAEYNIAVNALKPSAPTYSEGVAFLRPDLDPSTLRSPYLYMTKAAIFLAMQDAKGITGKIFFDEDLCKEFNLK